MDELLASLGRVLERLPMGMLIAIAIPGTAAGVIYLFRQGLNFRPAVAPDAVSVSSDIGSLAKRVAALEDETEDLDEIRRTVNDRHRLLDRLSDRLDSHKDRMDLMETRIEVRREIQHFTERTTPPTGRRR